MSFDLFILSSLLSFVNNFFKEVFLSFFVFVKDKYYYITINHTSQYFFYNKILDIYYFKLINKYTQLHQNY